MKKAMIKSLSVLMCLVVLCTSFAISPAMVSASEELLYSKSGVLTADDSYRHIRIKMNHKYGVRLEVNCDIPVSVKVYMGAINGYHIVDTVSNSVSQAFWWGTTEAWLDIEADLKPTDRKSYNFSIRIYDTTDYATSVKFDKHEYMFAPTQKTRVFYTLDKPCYKTLTLKSSDPNVVKVDSNNNFVTVGAGTCIITATLDNGASDSCRVTITYATDIKLIDKELVIYKDDRKYQLHYETSPKGLTQPTHNGDIEKEYQFPAKKIDWKSTKTSVARVDSSGYVVSTGLGKCRIYATLENGHRDYSRVIVKQIDVVGFEHSTISLPKINGKKHTSWKAGDKSIAYASDDKLVLKNPGWTVIKATVDGEEYICNIHSMSEKNFKNKAIKKFLKKKNRKKSQIKGAWRGFDSEKHPTVILKYSFKKNGKTKYNYYAYSYFKGYQSFRCVGASSWSKRPKLTDIKKI